MRKLTANRNVRFMVDRNNCGFISKINIQKKYL